MEHNMLDDHQYCVPFSKNDYDKTQNAGEMWKIVQTNGHPRYLTTNPNLMTDMVTDSNV
jgi:hypothetical protein